MGGYEIISKIGQGGMGAVFKARQVSVDRVVALKILPPKHAKQQQFLVRFLREAQAAARLDHPNIVQGIDAGQAGGYYYFAMEFVDGRTLKDILEAEGRLPERRALEITRDIARALDCAHEAGLIHRDVKPDNILVTANGTPKLADLGLAREAARTDSSVTVVGTALGTPDYISPEQVRGEADLDGRTDIYSLGATLYHLLTGSPPYTGGTRAEVMSKHLSKPVPNPRKADRQLSVGAVAIVRKAMAKKREQRYATAKELLQDVEHVLLGPEQAPDVTLPQRRPVTARKPQAPRRGQMKWVYVGGAAALLLAVLLIAPGSKPEQTPRQTKRTDLAHLPTTRPATDPPRVTKLGTKRPPKATTQVATVGPRDPAEAARARDQARVERVRIWVRANPGKYQEGIERYRNAISGMTDRVVKRRAGAALAAFQREAADAALKKEAAARAAAKKALEKLFSDVDTAAAKGDLTGAVRLAEAALNDEALKPVSDTVKLVATVCRILPQIAAKKRAHAVKVFKSYEGQVVKLYTPEGLKTGKVKSVSNETIVLERRVLENGEMKWRDDSVRIADLTGKTFSDYHIEWTPKTADEAIAAAILALAVKDANGAKAALQRAEGHGLHPRYAAKLAGLQFGDIELAAKKAWEKIAPYVATQKLGDPEADALAKLLNAFEQGYGRTRFAATVKDQIALLRSRLIPVFTEWPFAAAAAVQRRTITAERLGIPAQKSIDLGDGIKLEMALIPAGEFMMGSAPDEPARKDDEHPQRRVRITEPFYIGKYEVTQEQWEKVMGRNPSYFKGAKNPAGQLSWHDCQNLIRKLNGLGAGTFRLPTEAEWEFACRAGTDTAFHSGKSISPDQANYRAKEKHRAKTVPVGSFPPNAFGLHDMHGNLWELCADWYGAYAKEPQTNPPGPETGTERVARGGAWAERQAEIRSAIRRRRKPNFLGGPFGCRLALACGVRSLEGAKRETPPQPGKRVTYAAETVKKLFNGRVLRFDPNTLRIKLFYDFREPAQARDWWPSKWHFKKGDAISFNGGSLQLMKTRIQALTKARFTSAAIRADFAVSGGSFGATLLVCADGEGNHYELCGLWKDKAPPVWRSHLAKYIAGKFPAKEFASGKWPVRPSPFAASKRGAMMLSFTGGQLRGQVSRLVLEAKDSSLKSGHVGVWAFDADKAAFDNVHIVGTLERAWLDEAIKKAGLDGS